MKLFLILTILLLWAPAAFAASCSGPACTAVDGTNGCSLGAGVCRIYGENNTCKDITNTSGLSFFVPLKITEVPAQDNWVMFTSNPPTGVSPPADCTFPCAAVNPQNWTASGLNCSGPLPSASHGATSPVTDSTGPDTGSAVYSCNNTVWTLNAGATCSTTSGPCSTATQSWVAGGLTCSASVTGVAHGSPSTGTDSTGPDTGSATYTCNNGSWTLNAGSTCATTGAPCASTTGNWNPSGYACTGPLTGVAHGSNSIASDSTGPDTGSATYTCNNGTFNYVSGTCTQSSGPCTGGARSWVVGANTCIGNNANAADGASSSATDADADTNGTASFLCTNGSWSVQGGATCNAACASSTPTWSVSATCSATHAGATHGNSASANDSTGPDTGIASYLCSNGSWSLQSGASCSSAPASPCSTATLGWLTNCSGSIAGVASGSSSTGSNTVSGYTGSGTFSCSNGAWSYASGTCGASGPSYTDTLNARCNWRDGWDFDYTWSGSTTCSISCLDDNFTTTATSISTQQNICAINANRCDIVCYNGTPTRTGFFSGNGTDCGECP